MEGAGRGEVREGPQQGEKGIGMKRKEEEGQGGESVRGRGGERGERGSRMELDVRPWREMEEWRRNSRREESGGGGGTWGAGD